MSGSEFKDFSFPLTMYPRLVRSDPYTHKWWVVASATPASSSGNTAWWLFTFDKDGAYLSSYQLTTGYPSNSEFVRSMYVAHDIVLFRPSDGAAWYYGGPSNPKQYNLSGSSEFGNWYGFGNSYDGQTRDQYVRLLSSNENTYLVWIWYNGTTDGYQDSLQLRYKQLYPTVSTTIYQTQYTTPSGTARFDIQLGTVSTDGNACVLSYVFDDGTTMSNKIKVCQYMNITNGFSIAGPYDHEEFPKQIWNANTFCPLFVDGVHTPMAYLYSALYENYTNLYYILRINGQGLASGISISLENFYPAPNSIPTGRHLPVQKINDQYGVVAYSHSVSNGSFSALLFDVNKIGASAYKATYLYGIVSLSEAFLDTETIYSYSNSRISFLPVTSISFRVPKLTNNEVDYRIVSR